MWDYSSACCLACCLVVSHLLLYLPARSFPMTWKAAAVFLAYARNGTPVSLRLVVVGTRWNHWSNKPFAPL